MRVTPSDDYKNRREPDSFQMIDPEFAGTLLFCGLLIVVILFK